MASHDHDLEDDTQRTSLVQTEDPYISDKDILLSYPGYPINIHTDRPLRPEDLVHFVLVFADEDAQKANEFKNWFQHILEKNKLRDITVMDYTDPSFSPNIVRSPKDVSTRAINVLLLLTKHFVKDKTLNLFTDEAIAETRANPNSFPDAEFSSLEPLKDAIRPIHTEDGKRSYITPPGLSSRRFINYFNLDRAESQLIPIAKYVKEQFINKTKRINELFSGILKEIDLSNAIQSLNLPSVPKEDPFSNNHNECDLIMQFLKTNSKLKRQFASPAFIGKGSNGYVYSVHNLHHLEKDKTIALKFIEAENSRAIQRIKREVLIAVKLKYKGMCENIVTYDSSYLELRLFSRRFLCLKMEFCDGGTLGHKNDDFLRHHNRQIVTGLLNGLVFIHTHGIFHLDIHKGNILFKENIPKLSDFGSAAGSSLLGSGMSATELKGVDRKDLAKVFISSFKLEMDNNSRDKDSQPQSWIDYGVKKAIYSLTDMSVEMTLIQILTEKNDLKEDGASGFEKDYVKERNV